MDDAGLHDRSAHSAGRLVVRVAFAMASRWPVVHQAIVPHVFRGTTRQLGAPVWCSPGREGDDHGQPEPAGRE